MKKSESASPANWPAEWLTQLAHGEDFADSAAAAGVGYDRLLQQIVKLGMQYSPRILS